MIEQNSFLDRLDAYVEIVDQRTRELYARDYPNLKPPFFTVDPKGKRYARIVQNDALPGSSRSVHSFVDRDSGDVLFPAGWKGPARHPRGSIWSGDNGADALYGNGSVKKLR